jgi:hypothetical protein
MPALPVNSGTWIESNSKRVLRLEPAPQIRAEVAMAFTSIRQNRQASIPDGNCAFRRIFFVVCDIEHRVLWGTVIFIHEQAIQTGEDHER